MERIIKGYNSGHQECHLEITDAGAEGLIWLNVVYKKEEERKPHIVIDMAQLNTAINDIKQAGLF